MAIGDHVYHPAFAGSYSLEIAGDGFLPLPPAASRRFKAPLNSCKLPLRAA
jgi:hypothetical protein